MKLERKTWFKNKDYHMTYEETIDPKTKGEVVFVHVVFDNFSKRVLEDLREKWNDFKTKLYLLGYEFVFTYTKDMRIVKLIEGGKVIGQYENYKVVVWDLG